MLPLVFLLLRVLLPLFLVCLRVLLPLLLGQATIGVRVQLPLHASLTGLARALTHALHVSIATRLAAAADDLARHGTGDAVDGAGVVVGRLALALHSTRWLGGRVVVDIGNGVDGVSETPLARYGRLLGGLRLVGGGGGVHDGDDEDGGWLVGCVNEASTMDELATTVK